MQKDLFNLLLITGTKGDFDHVAISGRLKKHAARIRLCDSIINLPMQIKMQCDSRATELVRRRLAKSGMKHLKKEDFAEIADLLGGVPLTAVISESDADELASKIHVEFPWLAPATEYAWNAMRLSASRGEPVKLDPVLLAGAPGLGKTAWSHQIASEISTPLVDVDASSGAGQFALVGLERGWSNAEAGRIVRTLIQEKIGNPVVFIDEVDKSKVMQTKGGRSLSMSDALLPLLETQSSKRWFCPFYALPFDMTKLSWIFAANDVSRIPGFLRSRVEIVNIAPPDIKTIEWFTEREATRAGLSCAATEAALEAIEESGKRLRRPLNLRDAQRIVQRAEALETRPVFH